MPIPKKQWLMAADDFPRTPDPKRAEKKQAKKMEPAELLETKIEAADDEYEGASLEDFIAESTVAEVRALVTNGTLTAEEVYNAEKAGKQRATLLHLYGNQ